MNNIFSIFSIQGGEMGKSAALILTQTLARKLRKRTVYIPVGVAFDDIGNTSMTELYFDFVKGRDLRLDINKDMEILRSFNCFAELSEITEEDYYKFIETVTNLFELSVINIERLSAKLIIRFFEVSMITAIVIDCAQKGYMTCFESFIKNLKLLWKINREEKEENLKGFQNFIFIINNGTHEEKNIINEIVSRELESKECSLQDKIFLIEEGEISSKGLIRGFSQWASRELPDELTKSLTKGKSKKGNFKSIIKGKGG